MEKVSIKIKDEKAPIVGITIGDAAGIGPEIALKAAGDPEVVSVCRPVLIGDISFLDRVSRTLAGARKLVPFVESIESSREGIAVLDTHNLPEEVPVGIDDPVTGKASAECIQLAVDHLKAGSIDAVATAPISKKAIALGGYSFPGHTEFLADLTETLRFSMSFFADSLRVVLLSTHLPLREAIDLVRQDKLVPLISFTDREMSKLLGRKVSIAVAGINPHASEGGMFGDEEENEIIPAIEKCREDMGINVTGPYSPDTVFLRGFRGEFDVVIACYHDQATIAVKSLSFGSAVNVTLGLPIIRTSVDHGTAYDIAGKGVADASSMKAAIVLAAELVRTRRSDSFAETLS
ncbi:MAG TPA: 4-hydroxythreonine-4-phosphate dehydrogenase PdxA [Pyrinomonadaceae bacterium]|nr:4-hydroxythreonine-4-phosphate dehydrogenase PdxA [Pyrinomonadaceae bacterium]